MHESPFLFTRLFGGRIPWEVCLLLLFVLGNFCLRMPELSIRGEESRRAQVARDMLRTNDWVVSRIQGQIYLTKPPFFGWMIALSVQLIGEFNVWSVRLPSLLATLATVLLIYGYGRQWLNRFGAFAAALAFATMGEVLKSGWQGEIDPLFTLFIAASLFLWHVGYTRRWHPVLVWSLGYALASLGMLTKGVQAPLYFCGGTFVYLLLRRDWRFLVHPGNVVGMAVFGGIFSLWLVPFLSALGWESVRHVFGGEVKRTVFFDAQLGRLLGHMAAYPLDTLGCLLPWSFFLLAYFWRSFRERLQETWPLVLFAVVCVAVAFPTCWFAPNAVSRYFRPLYPSVALLVGVVLQRFAEGGLAVSLQQSWAFFRGFLAVAMVGTGCAIALLALAPLNVPEHWVQTPGFASVFLLVVAFLATVQWQMRHRQGAAAALVTVLSLAGFTSLAMTGVFTNTILNRGLEIAPQVAELKHQIHQPARLVSFDPIHHRFAYYYGEYIPVQPWPRTLNEVPDDVEYFCFFRAKGIPERPLPFPWECVAEVPMKRYRNGPSAGVVVVGKRLPKQVAKWESLIVLGAR